MQSNNEQTVKHLESAFAGASLEERLHSLRRIVKGRIVFTTSFGLEDQAISHAIVQAGLDVELITLDTGRLFQETCNTWAQTEAAYSTRIHAYVPDREAVESVIALYGVNGFYASREARHECCRVRKVEPLSRALAGAQAWITGLRGDASNARADMQAVSWDTMRKLIKVNPVIEWTRNRVKQFVHDNHIPINSLHARGYASIGCAPCTRPIGPDEPERAGRWWWENDDARECGLHVDEHGRLVRAAPEEKRS